ncbi:hypothetical protein KVR01_007303 [Diaporthe batatas]|uniref:uncharacterized protein n=1 Tax=Diaporthe batatas TaxID=748121 RepID=UPI001D03EEA8|nr:uncharacterized protein KVR01_007303 [Diaporthe batatas]KAG8162825.1 hypothetical protein KVR01_007303 [Diaporthe batatas]
MTSSSTPSTESLESAVSGVKDYPREPGCPWKSTRTREDLKPQERGKRACSPRQSSSRSNFAKRKAVDLENATNAVEPEMRSDLYMPRNLSRTATHGRVEKPHPRKRSRTASTFCDNAFGSGTQVCPQTKIRGSNIPLSTTFRKTPGDGIILGRTSVFNQSADMAVWAATNLLAPGAFLLPFPLLCQKESCEKPTFKMSIPDTHSEESPARVLWVITDAHSPMTGHVVDMSCISRHQGQGHRDAQGCNIGAQNPPRGMSNRSKECERVAALEHKTAEGCRTGAKNVKGGCTGAQNR